MSISKSWTDYLLTRRPCWLANPLPVHGRRSGARAGGRGKLVDQVIHSDEQSKEKVKFGVRGPGPRARGPRPEARNLELRIPSLVVRRPGTAVDSHS